jgi:hypothetical protein
MRQDSAAFVLHTRSTLRQDPTVNVVLVCCIKFTFSRSVNTEALLDYECAILSILGYTASSGTKKV